MVEFLTNFAFQKSRWGELARGEMSYWNRLEEQEEKVERNDRG